ncbi:hypothetical protein BV25DRAFT_1884350 [Artomyces pyxidatus]|uniref:Uncharacterized protein n=1 Tax=Artomyces pyxidatus TaxID=48021 RepID=A0ACB8T535_9AGAM|nr:hypothetical protein BV25DRAFT_1884350 [Artomyces pyxidatus]
MELGSHLASKLEPFVLMSKSAKGAAAAKLVKDATSAPGVYFFAELLDVPNVKELSSSEHSASYSLLELFSYKTYQDYLQHKESLPELSPAHLTKLKHLSLLSFAMQQRILSYSYLQSALDISTIRQLEDLIIDAIYLDIVRGKLDQKEQQFEVEYTIGRDVPPENITDILTALENWSSTTAGVLQTLDAKITSIADQNLALQHQTEDHQRILAANLKEIAERQREGKSSTGKRSGNAGGARKDRERERERDREEDGMDVDEGPAEGSKGKNRKASQEIPGKTRSKRNRM